MQDSLTELKKLGNRQLVNRDYEGAIKVFQQLIQESPESADGYIGLAKTLARRKEYQAIVDTVGPVANRVNSAQLKSLLADAYRVLVFRGKKEYVDAAINAFEDYHQEREDSVSLYYLAEIYRSFKKDFARAADVYQASWDREQRGRLAYQGLLSCLGQLGRDDEVVRAKALWKERNPPKKN